MVLPQRDRLPFLHRGRGIQDGFMGMPFYPKKVSNTPTNSPFYTKKVSNILEKTPRTPPGGKKTTCPQQSFSIHRYGSSLHYL